MVPRLLSANSSIRDDVVVKFALCDIRPRHRKKAKNELAFSSQMDSAIKAQVKVIPKLVAGRVFHRAMAV
jgi:hypothetical protein